MEWTKIPTDLLQSRLSDKEILAITKYQTLWAMLERQPDEKTCLRYMTAKQYQQALMYESAIKCRVDADIKSVINHRNRQKIFYVKNQSLSKKSDGQCGSQCASQYDSQSASPDKIRLDKNILSEKKKEDTYSAEFETFWDLYPRQRRGNKDKAYKAYCRAIENKRATSEQILEAVKKYAKSKTVLEGYAKGCEAWLNDDRFNWEYESQREQGPYYQKL